MFHTVRTMARVAACLWIAAAATPHIAAQIPHPDPECNTRLEHHKVEQYTKGQISCSAGIPSNLNFPGLAQVRLVCPQIMTIYPAYSQSVPAIGSGIKTNFLGALSVQTVFFRCDSTWFLFIPYRDDCVIDKVLNTGRRDHYGFTMCAPAGGVMTP